MTTTNNHSTADVLTGRKVLRLAPTDCTPHPTNAKMYGNATESVNDAFVASVEEYGGNFRPGWIVPDKDSPGRYIIRAGHRRWAACMKAEVDFLAIVLPDDLSDEEIDRLAREDNTHQRHRDEVTRMFEAIEAIPRLQAYLDENRRLGKGRKPPPGRRTGTLYDLLAEDFFGDLGEKDQNGKPKPRGRSHVEKLHTIVLTSLGQGKLIGQLSPDTSPIDGSKTGLSEDQSQLKALAQRRVDQLRDPEAYKVSVSGAEKELREFVTNALGLGPPDERTPDQIERARHKAARGFDDRLTALANISEIIKPWSSMNEQQRADLRAGLDRRGYAEAARRLPRALRVLADFAQAVREQSVHSRKATTTDDVMLNALDQGGWDQLADALYALDVWADEFARAKGTGGPVLSAEAEFEARAEAQAEEEDEALPAHGLGEPGVVVANHCIYPRPE